MKEYLNCRK